MNRPPLRRDAFYVENCKPYQCGHCSQSFSQPSDLRNHVVTHSSSDFHRPFQVRILRPKAFAGATTLNNHIRTHTGEKPFNIKEMMFGGFCSFLYIDPFPLFMISVWLCEYFAVTAAATSDLCSPHQLLPVMFAVEENPVLLLDVLLVVSQCKYRR
ncbi:hypothetical protein L3Q82_006987 [Scortum barcoo]|uniref:Uncharacterized protein n=1 Tax=Scortum barcoo TaxID=214431 RepID=A0ACB8WWI5_9TELE|nr:hypothetical protein L3Q82_006987 [Scortum barcoo]